MIRTLKGKLMLWNALTLVGSLIIVEFIVYFSVKSYLYQEIDALLQAEAEEVAAQLHFRNGQIQIPFEHEWQEMEHVAFGEHSIYLQILTPDGQLVRQSHNLQELKLGILPTPDSHRTTPRLTFSNMFLATQPARKLDYPLYHDGALAGYLSAIYVTTDLESHLARFRKAFLLITPICLALALGGIWLISRRSLTPITRIIRTANHIMRSSNLQHRIETGEADEELHQLIHTLNNMFARLQTSFEEIRTFAASASHQLRTPLTVMRSNIEVALNRNRTPREYRETLECLLEEVIKMSTVVHNLLLLARIESDNGKLPMGLIRLDRVLQNCLRSLQPVAHARNIRLQAQVDERIEVLGNEELLAELIHNLVDNAIKYNHPQGTATVRLRREETHAVLEVEDTGPGIPLQDRHKIFERFYRISHHNNSPTWGSGLGLAIAKWIVQKHSGRIFVKNTSPQGSCFRVEFPLIEFEMTEV